MPNGDGHPSAALNGPEKSQLRTSLHKDLSEHSKQSAKAVAVDSSSSAAAAASSPLVKPDGALGSSTTSDAQPNEAAKSRKRSRSGSRISRSPHGARLDDARPTRDKAMLETYVNRQQLHNAASIDSKEEYVILLGQMMREREGLFQVWHNSPEKFNIEALGLGYAGYGNGLQDAQNKHEWKLIRPAARRRPGNRRTKELRIGRKDQAAQAEQIDELVPIRLDIEWDKIRLRDTFTWNIHDRVIVPELFAQQLLEDLNPDLAHNEALVHQIVNSMQEQIHDFHPHVFMGEEALDPHLPYFAYKNDEMRIVIKLNITIGQHTLVDQFEWDINSPLNSPEEFAKKMTADLSLSGEFTTAIAHSIREQCQLFTRSLYVTGHPFDGRPIEDHELLGNFQPSPLPSVFRPHQAAKDFTPYLYELNDQELEKNEMSLSREERRQKRSVNRRGGPILPDLKDRRRTIRTLLVSSVLPGAVQSHEDSRLFKRTVVSHRGKRGLTRMDGLDDSEESDSEDSSVDSPAGPVHLLPGTARTRGMRGAAAVSQAATRANLGRSATPDSSILHHHETRTSGRRIVHDESSPEPPTKIIKLRLPRSKFKALLERLGTKNAATTQSTPLRPTSRQSSTAPTPTPGSMAPPVSTPRMPSQALPTQPNGTPTSQAAQIPATSKHGATSALGRVDATGPPGPDHPIVSYNSSIFGKSTNGVRATAPIYLTASISATTRQISERSFRGKYEIHRGLQGYG